MSGRSLPVPHPGLVLLPLTGAGYAEAQLLGARGERTGSLLHLMLDVTVENPGAPGHAACCARAAAAMYGAAESALIAPGAGPTPVPPGTTADSALQPAGRASGGSPLSGYSGGAPHGPGCVTDFHMDSLEENRICTLPIPVWK